MDFLAQISTSGETSTSKLVTISVPIRLLDSQQQTIRLYGTIVDSPKICPETGIVKNAEN